MLTLERIDAEAFARCGEMKGAPLAMCRGFARSIEAEARKDALEEAAKLCGNLTSEWTPEECAEKIRARLKETP